MLLLTETATPQEPTPIRIGAQTSRARNEVLLMLLIYKLLRWRRAVNERVKDIIIIFMTLYKFVLSILLQAL